MILADPSKPTPPIVLEVASFVAVAALPVVDPDVPETLPVTLPVNAPTKVVDVVTPVVNTSPSGLRVIPDPTRVSFLNVAIPATSNIPVLTFAVTAIPVRADPSIAGNVEGNLASGMVPDDKLLALKALIIEDVTNAAPLVS